MYSTVKRTFHISIRINCCCFFSMVLQAHSGPWPLIQLQGNTNTVNAYTHQTSMSWMGFEPTIPASERAKINCSYSLYIYIYIYIPIKNEMLFGAAVKWRKVKRKNLSQTRNR
jgi:hypothetical protein